MNRRSAVLMALMAALAIVFFAPLLLDAIREEGPPPLPGEKPLLTEFGDFQCPHCARFALTVVPEIRRELVETGQADYEYRHYPFLGPESYAAAEAAECARDQDAFDRYHDLVYGAVSRGKSPDLRLLLDTARRGGTGPGGLRAMPPVRQKEGQGHGGQGVRQGAGRPGHSQRFPERPRGGLEEPAGPHRKGQGKGQAGGSPRGAMTGSRPSKPPEGGRRND